MGWLSERFIQTAQESPLAGDIPKEKIPEVLRLVATGKDAVLRLLNSKNEVIEITECEMPVYMRKARTYLQENAPEYRDSIMSALTASSGSSGAHSVFSDQPRSSIASTNTSASIFSTRAQSVLIQKSVPVPTSFAKCSGKPHICPTCGKEFRHPWDLAKHVRAFHESLIMVFQCGYCEQTSEDRSVVELHCRRAHPAHIRHVHVLPSFDKVAYGCSFCETPACSLDAYLKCMVDDQKDPTLLPIPAKRLRALLRQSDVTIHAIEQACERRQLSLNAWKQLTWNDNDCDTYSRRLEYGCNGHDDIHRPGVDNIHQFIEQILENATFESTGRPVPPPKDSIGAAGNIMPTNNAPALNTASLNFSGGPQYHHDFTESPAFNSTHILCPPTPYISYPKNMAPKVAAIYRDRAVSGIEGAAKQSSDQATLMSKIIPAATVAPPKRHPSLDSASHPENRSRAKRHPVVDKLTLPEWITDRPDSTVLPTQNCPSLIATNMPTHPAATAKGAGEATESPNPVFDYIGMYERRREPVVLADVEFGHQFGLEAFENEQGYSYEPWADDQNPFLNQQSLGTRHDDQRYNNNNDQQSYDNRHIYNNHRSFDDPDYNQQHYINN